MLLEVAIAQTYRGAAFYMWCM